MNLALCQDQDQDQDRDQDQEEEDKIGPDQDEDQVRSLQTSIETAQDFKELLVIESASSRRSISGIYEPTMKRAKNRIQSWRNSQMRKVWTFLYRTRWELPMICFGALLSILTGSISASKGHYQAMLINGIRDAAVGVGNLKASHLKSVVSAMLIMEVV